MTVEAGNMLLLFIVQPGIGYVFEVYDMAIGIVYNGVLYFFYAFILAAGFYIEGFGAGAYTATGNIGGLALYAAHHGIEGYMLLCYLIQLQVYAHYLFRHAP